MALPGPPAWDGVSMHALHRPNSQQLTAANFISSRQQLLRSAQVQAKRERIRILTDYGKWRQAEQVDVAFAALVEQLREHGRDGDTPWGADGLSIP